MSEYTREQRIEDLTRRLKFYRERLKDADFAATAARFQRQKAIDCLLKIIDSSDQDAAIEDARAWLVKYFKGENNFRLNSSIVNLYIPAALAQIQRDRDEEWPEEINVCLEQSPEGRE